MTRARPLLLLHLAVLATVPLVACEPLESVAPLAVSAAARHDESALPTDTASPAAAATQSGPPAADLHVMQVAIPLKYRQVCARISPEGGVLENGPARLDFPRGAVAASTDICM